jgi:hypothetical protein
MSRHGDKMASKQTYKYKKENSIVGNLIDDYSLSEREYYEIYSFYVTYSMCGSQSAKKRTFLDYGWDSGNIHNTELGQALKRVVDLGGTDFIFTDQDELKEKFNLLSLNDGAVSDFSFERCVIGKTSEPNKYLKLFYRVRDGFAHGKYCLRLSEDNIKMVVIQDDDGYNVTGRIVIQLRTLLAFINVIDINHLI